MKFINKLNLLNEIKLQRLFNEINDNTSLNTIN